MSFLDRVKFRYSGDAAVSFRFAGFYFVMRVTLRRRG